MLTALELQNIRSYKSALFEFTSGVNIVLGPNASGKTNLLEAIHMVAEGSGFKSGDSDMVMRGSVWGRIDAVFTNSNRTVKLRLEPPDKSFIIDDVEKKRLIKPAALPVVLFEPGHMLLLGGEPERRRSYLDGVLSQINLGYKNHLSSYKRVLAQRNRLLKQDIVTPEHMFVWDLRLSELASAVVERRREYTERLQPVFAVQYRSVSGTDDELEVVYESKLPMESYADALLKSLKSDFALDRTRGFTGSGPHRDDIAIRLNGNEARSSASRGETRSIVLALKIVEFQEVTSACGHSPLFLLDDVFSELDGRRRRLLAETLQDTQTFITTTDADAIVKSFMADYNVITTKNDR